MSSPLVQHTLKEAVRACLGVSISPSINLPLNRSQEVERFAVGDFLAAVLNTIVFHRAMGVVHPQEVWFS